MSERSEVMEPHAVNDAAPAYPADSADAAPDDMPPGYKRTSVGVIPEDWAVARLTDLVISGPKNGYSGSSGKDAYGTPTLNLAATSAGSLVLNDDTVKRLNEVIDPRSDLFLRAGDVLVQRSNTSDLVGTTAIFTGPNQTYVYPDLMTRLRFRDDVSAHWFWRWANSAQGRRHFERISAGSTGSMPKISGEKLRKTLLPMPPSREQSAIATALSDADALIESLDRLIAKKRAIKQAAMQQLLTGETRLPGFSGEWETKRLGDVSNIKTGDRNNQDKVEDGAYPFFVRSEFVERINSYSYDCEAIVVPGEGRIGDIFHYINGRFDVHQRVYAITHFHSKVSPRFIYYQMMLKFGAWAMRNTVKATVDSLRLPTFQSFELWLPPTEDEQTAIAAALSDMDTEIEALERRRDKARQIKQGMMQQLLTGRVRLVEPGATA